MNNLPTDPSETNAEDLQDSGDSRFKTPAENPDLRIGRVEVFNVMAIDLSELVARPIEDRRILQRLRANDSIFDAFKTSLIGRIPGCADESEDIRTRMTESLALGGKAVWTDQFLDRFAPIRLPLPSHMVRNDNEIGPRDRLSSEPGSPLHYVRFQRHRLQMFRDGTISYTVRTTFEDRTSSDHGGRGKPPASVSEAISRLKSLDDLLANNLRIVLANLLRARDFRRAISDGVQADEDSLELIDESQLHSSTLKRRCKHHTVIFVERFFDSQRAESLSSVIGAEADFAQVDLQSVLTSSSLAGLLNTASWYDRYDLRYVKSLTDKEIGYRDDEIYISDGSSTIISARGFWNEGSVQAQGADPLTHYKWDIVLAVEYNVAYVAYCISTLAYYQSHPDVSGLENSKPLTALPHVIDGRAILSHLDQSLDLALLVDHGFTRKFIRRLREELGLSTEIGFIRTRVEDGSTSVGLKSAVLSAENTSVESLGAVLENNEIQRTIRAWAIIAILVAITLFTLRYFLNHHP